MLGSRPAVQRVDIDSIARERAVLVADGDNP
jgi:hypothetical protein